MRVSTRFDVFKRDGFTCQYCGRKTPDVVLEVDHVIPRADGGGDEMENLVTACWDCNRGKSAKSLDDRARAPAITEQTEMLREREAQLRAYHALRDEIVERRERTYNEVRNHWFDVWGVRELKPWHMPYENVVRSAIEKLGPAEVMDAMDIAGARFRYVTADALRYFGGVLKRKVAAHEGRLVPCEHCQRDIVLTPKQLAENPLATWHHAGCAPTTGAEDG